jgi:integrase
VKLQQMQGTAARALEWLIATRCRPGEAVGAARSETDGKLWRIPPVREKVGRGLVVALSGEALAILAKLDGRGLPNASKSFRPFGAIFTLRSSSAAMAPVLQPLPRQWPHASSA